MINDEFLNDFTFMELTEDVLAECEHFSCGVGYTYFDLMDLQH